MRLYPISLYFLILAAATGSLASSGDRSNEFQRCLQQCVRQSCALDGQQHSLRPQPFVLRLTRWTCMDNCKYTCMHTLTDLAIESGVRMQQYYGKWPFWRFAGMQEPASVAFSLANLLMHVLGADWLRRGVHPAHPMRPFYLTWAYVSINAWIWSAVFHTRDTPLTERLDYFSAALAILYALYMAVVRLFHLYAGTPTFPSRPSRRPLFHVWRALSTLVYFAHIAYLGFAAPFTRFAAMPRSYRPAHAGTAALAVALTTAATALELFDFPPWGRVLDAHALWHLATVPLAVMWYDFLLMDAQDAGWRGQRL
ncbi:Per1-like protein [Multifurca ochricompacta]|uniref:Post-GPI attachment to proteins factor 3 n=1 Tax=Multifurca ochricompacta TaxID=376703 RepID=A0AAD4M6C1_9AGAM|nr:Per1-like protein [Multifurca ochricompacta]